MVDKKVKNSQPKTGRPLAEKSKIQNEEIKNLQSQINDLENKWKRALADYQNLEKRIEKEKTSLVGFLNASLIDKLLGVLDDLERAEAHLKNKGLSISVSQFKEVLKTEGVEKIKAKGQDFNPETMDCVEMVKGPENIVINVTLKGYKLNGQVLRPAKVKVGKNDHQGGK